MALRPAIRQLCLRSAGAARHVPSTRDPISKPWSNSRSSRFSTRSRPTIAFASPIATTQSTATARTYASERTRQWLRREARLFVRYALLSVGGSFCVFVIYYLYRDELVERDYPTPHEWDWRERKLLRDAHKWTDPKHHTVSWAMSFQFARNLCIAFEDPKRRGDLIPRLHDHEDPNDEWPGEFIPHDISQMSEEWRRGYFETIMLAAKGAAIVDGYVKKIDNTANHVWAPNFVIGPSNPRPWPVPPGSPPAPREEDCEVCFPPADRFYLKILGTKGLSSRQRLQAALEYAHFIETKRRPEDAEALYNLALAEATRGLDQSKLPYNPKTLVLKNKAGPPSQNVIEAITAYANYRARSGDTSATLPVYLSLLKARRALPNTAPRVPAPPKPQKSFIQQALSIFAEPDYPSPPPDGTQPPWRSPVELCQEASLNVHIGEILYATSPSSREDGIAWTREGIDLAEEQLRRLNAKSEKNEEEKQRCRECLKAGLDNWSVMVSRLAEEEKQRRETPGQSVFSFWNTSSKEAAEGRWEAEESVVKDRIRRTGDLLEGLSPLSQGVWRYFKA